MSHMIPDLSVVNGWRWRPFKAAGWLGTTTPQTACWFAETADLSATRRFLGQRLEWFGLELSVFLQQNLNFSFCLFQFFPTGGRKLHAFLEERQRLLQRDL